MLWIILNIVEISIMEENRNKARKFVKIFHDSYDELNFFDRDKKYYDEKIRLFENFISSENN